MQQFKQFFLTMLNHGYPSLTGGKHASLFALRGLGCCFFMIIVLHNVVLVCEPMVSWHRGRKWVEAGNPVLHADKTKLIQHTKILSVLIHTQLLYYVNLGSPIPGEICQSVKTINNFKCS